MYNVKLSSVPIFPLKVNKTHVQKRRFMIKLDLFDFMYVKVVKNLEIKNNNYTCRFYLCFILRNKQIKCCTYASRQIYLLQISAGQLGEVRKEHQGKLLCQLLTLCTI